MDFVDLKQNYLLETLVTQGLLVTDDTVIAVAAASSFTVTSTGCQTGTVLFMRVVLSTSRKIQHGSS